MIFLPTVGLGPPKWRYRRFFWGGGHVETQYTSHIRVLCITVPAFLNINGYFQGTSYRSIYYPTTVDYENNGFHVIFSLTSSIKATTSNENKENVNTFHF